MKKIQRSLVFILLISISISLLSGCSGSRSDPERGAEETNITDSEKFDALCNELFMDQITSSGLTVHTFFKNPEEYGINDYPNVIDSIDLNTWDEDQDETKAYYKELTELDTEDFTDEQLITYEIIASELKDSLEIYNFKYYSEPMDSSSGIQAILPVLMSEFRLYDKDDLDDYLEILSSIEQYFDDLIKYEEEKSAAGLFMSDEVADRIINQCETFIADPENNLLITTFDKTLSDRLPSLTNKELEEYKEKNRDVVINTVIPSYKKLITGIESLKGTSKNDGGLCGFKNGKDYYSYLIKTNVGTDKTPEELIELIDEQLMDYIMAISIVAARNPEIVNKPDDPEFVYTDPAEALAYLEKMAAEHFPEMPTVNYQVKYVDRSLEDTMNPAFYLSPPIDDYNNNVIYINGSSQIDQNSLFPIIAHEGYPGHLYETTYDRSLERPLIRILTGSTGFSEGWATYAEAMAYSWGIEDKDVADILMYNKIATLLIYCRLDLGIHYEGWTIEDADDFLSGYFDLNDDSLKDIYYTILEIPSDYLCYGIGFLELTDLRRLAEDSLGDKFDEIDFHKFIMDFGNAGFNIIRSHLEQYITDNGGTVTEEEN